MAKSLIKCSHCGNDIERENSHINRSKRENKPLFCDRKCFGLAYRLNKSKEELIKEKAIYDKQYRTKNIITITEKKKAYFQRTYNPESAAIERKKNMHKHIEYCRKPSYVAKKKIYDRKRKAKQSSGEFWESKVLTLDIRDECLSQISDYEIRLNNGTLNKTQTRHRYEQKINRTNSN